MKSVRFGIALLAAGTTLTAAPHVAAAQQVGAYREDAGTALNRHLRTLADQPRNLSALSGAGKAALELGDAQAALTFYARAEEIAPRDGRVKAGMGSAFVQMEQPIPAMKFFEEAASLGVSPAEFGGDRGLAYDLAGDPRRAQADYNLALRREENDEVRRRLALSYAISGEREKALATIDAQLRRQDRAAWRTRAFILALGGDAAGATKAAEAAMPAQASQMRPFFAGLPSLSPAQRAMAVHFGHYPGDGQIQMANAPTQYASASPAATEAGRPDGGQTQLGRLRNPPAGPVSTAARRRPGTESRVREERERPNSRIADRFPGSERVTSRQRTVRQPSATPAQGQQIRQAEVQGPSLTPPITQPVPAADQPVRQAEVAPQVVTPSVQTQAAPAASQPLASIVQPVPEVQGPPAPVPGFSQPATTTSSLQPQQPAVIAGSQINAAPAQLAPQAVPTIAPVELPPSAVAGGQPIATPATVPAQPDSTIAKPAFADIAATIAALAPETNPAAVNTAPEEKKQAFAQLDVKPAPQKTAPEPEKKPEPAKKPAAAKKEEPAKKPQDMKKAEAEKKANSDKKPDQAKKTDTAKKAEPPKPKEPSRHWVQIAGGADKAAMDREFARIKAKAPKLLGSRTPWTTPLRFTNRLLVGPFDSTEEAQEFVNELAKLDLSAFSWTSPAGQEIVKLSAK